MTNHTETDNPIGEAVSTAALFLNVAAVISLVICLGALAGSQFAVVAFAGVVAVSAFTGSVICFIIDERRTGDHVMTLAQPASAEA
jgi:hypothetical protein